MKAKIIQKAKKTYADSALNKCMSLYPIQSSFPVQWFQSRTLDKPNILISDREKHENFNWLFIYQMSEEARINKKTMGTSHMVMVLTLMAYD